MLLASCRLCLLLMLLLLLLLLLATGFKLQLVGERRAWHRRHGVEGGPMRFRVAGLVAAGKPFSARYACDGGACRRRWRGRGGMLNDVHTYIHTHTHTHTFLTTHPQILSHTGCSGFVWMLRVCVRCVVWSRNGLVEGVEWWRLGGVNGAGCLPLLPLGH